MSKKPVVIEIYPCIYDSKYNCPFPCIKCENYPKGNMVYCKNYPNKCVKCGQCEHYKLIFPNLAKKEE